MEKAKRQSAAIMTPSNSSNGFITHKQLASPSVSPSRLVGEVINEAFQSSQDDMLRRGSADRGSPSSSTPPERRHSRGFSRSGGVHNRGHSRAGSISLTQTALTNGVVAAALGHIAQKKSITSASVPRLVSNLQHIANTAHSHTRGHSRSGSRSLAASSPGASRSRPQSYIGGILTESKNQVQAIGDDSWADEQAASLDSAIKTPVMNGRFADPFKFETPVQQSGSISTISSAAPAPSVSLTMPTPDASVPSHTRRPSRHSRKGSVSTRRESMEIMGGLANHEANSTSNRHSRRISNSHRWSGLQTASVLFGGEPDYVPFGRKREISFEGELSNDEDGSRQTALEKLEGKRSNRASLQSTVQLPSFDDVHGDQGMDKRASLNLLEANVQSTSSEKLPTAIVPASPRPLNLMDAGKDLGVLVEEEEEEDESGLLSPIREKGSIDFASEEEKRKQKLAEEREIIKRNRRGSLTPQPLKLKSRPASLFVAPRASRLSTSHSLPSLCDMLEEGEQMASIPHVAPALSKGLAMSPLPNTARSTPNMSSPRSIPPSRQETPRESPLQTVTSIPRNLPSARLLHSSPPRDTKRAWRSSMPMAEVSPGKNAASPSSVTSSGGSRQGMRMLRLGASNLSTSSNASSTLLREHKANTDSTSSLASVNSGASVSMSKRGSLLYNNSPASSNVAFKDDMSPLARKRGSLIYKSSPLDPKNLSHVSSSSMSAGGSYTLTMPQQQAPNGSISAPAFGGVPMNLFEELKSKHQREVGLLDEARTKIAKLEDAAEAEARRKSNELAEVEKWSVEEKKALGLRIEHLEANIVQIVQVREAKERNLLEEKARVESELTKVQSDFEDVEAERDMLRDDVDGWRERCSGLEKVLRTERQHAEDLRGAKSAAKNRIRELLEKLKENNIEVDRSSVDEEELSVELKAILRSPQLNSSPMLNATSSPVLGDIASQIPPPQAVQLLKEMRQQIFNLAGTLEHERKQHLLTRQEADEIKMELSRVTALRQDDESMQSATDAKMEVPSMSTPPHSSSEKSSNKRNHVFAYDSSMESRSGSNSLGSGSALTNQTSQYEDEEGKSKDEDMVSAAQSPADLFGLGVGNLMPLAEEEEIDHIKKTDTTPPTPPLDHHRDQSSIKTQEPLQTSSGSVNSSKSSSSAESRGPPSPTFNLTDMAGKVSGSSQDTVHLSLEAEIEDEDEIISPMMESRPEFIREWSFQTATAKVKKSSGNKSRPSRPNVITKGLQTTRSKGNRRISIEDFFGIMRLDEDESLPPLPTPNEALEMPPLYIETDYRMASNKQYSNNSLPRYPSTIRPPIPPTSKMYNRSMSERSSSSMSRTASFNNHLPQPAMMQRSTSADSESSLYSVGGGMLSRVVSITSAFGGYLLGGSNESDQEMKRQSQQQQSQSHHVYDNDNLGWAVTKREEEEFA